MRFIALSAFFAAGLFAPVCSFSQTIPDALLQPIRGEAPRYPRDTVIGVLGPGGAPEEAWLYAKTFLDGLVAGNVRLPEEASGADERFAGYLDALKDAAPRRYHLGGGRAEEDGAVSFLVRFIGRESWVTGELYLRTENAAWRLDDLVLEEARTIEEGKNAYPHDFSPYERFF